MSLIISSPNDISSEQRRVLGQPINDPLIPNPLNAGIKSIMPLEDGNFAVAGFQFDENYQLPSNPLTVGSVAELDFGNMAEIQVNSSSEIISYTAQETNYTVFASETKGNQILLNFYSDTGEIRGSHRIGFLNPFTLSTIKVGNDNSLLVLGTTFVAGRFERITLNKLSPKEVGDIVN
ncbi:MAG: hypothetical protein AAFY41_06510 [Bacteroidota bacterium]